MNTSEKATASLKDTKKVGGKTFQRSIAGSSVDVDHLQWVQIDANGQPVRDESGNPYGFEHLPDKS